MIIFTDLDDTIMQTKRKIKTSLEDLTVGAFNNEGVPNSYIDKKRALLIQQLFNNNTVIPVTARTMKSFDNLKIDFQHHAVLSFGAIILNPDKSINKEWETLINEKSISLKVDMLFSEISKLLNTLNLQIEIRNMLGPIQPHYLTIRSIEMSTPVLNTVKQTIIDYLTSKNLLNDFYFYQTDRDVALMPSFIKKELAVDFLLDNFYNREELIVGMGDHKNDFSFMEKCDFSIFPNDSSIAKLLKGMPCL